MHLKKLGCKRVISKLVKLEHQSNQRRVPSCTYLLVRTYSLITLPNSLMIYWIIVQLEESTRVSHTRRLLTTFLPDRSPSLAHRGLSNHLTSFLFLDIQDILTPLGPAWGTLYPPCHVFAYNRANTRTSLLKNLDFSQLWVWKRAVRFLPHKVISSCRKKWSSSEIPEFL